MRRLAVPRFPASDRGRRRPTLRTEEEDTMHPITLHLVPGSNDSPSFLITLLSRQLVGPKSLVIDPEIGKSSQRNIFSKCWGKCNLTPLKRLGQPNLKDIGNKNPNKDSQKLPELQILEQLKSDPNEFHIQERLQSGTSLCPRSSLSSASVGPRKLCATELDRIGLNYLPIFWTIEKGNG